MIVKFNFFYTVLKQFTIKFLNYAMYNRIIYIIFCLLLSCDNNNSNSYTCDDLEVFPELINFSLEDRNPNSITYGEFIGPVFFSDTVRLFYFSNNPD